MFGGVRAYSGCIRSRGPYCGMSYECVEVDSELVLRQDPINGAGPLWSVDWKVMWFLDQSINGLYCRSQL
jgi:hypothetical protein